MRYLKSINEKLGINYDVFELANQIFDKLQESKKFTIEARILDQDIIINCQIVNSLGGYTAATTHMSKNKNVFELITTRLAIDTILHEVMHIFQHVARKFKIDSAFTSLDYTNKILVRLHKHKINNPNLLKEIVYYTSRDEFESYYLEFYINILNKLVKDNITDKNKIRNIIHEYLNSHDCFIVNEYVYKHKVDISDFFNGTHNLSKYIQDLNEIDIMYKNDIYNSVMERDNYIVTKLKDLLQIFKHKKELSPYEQSTLKKINNIINKNAERNYKKFFRLYSHFC